ncbi:hypothetical protein IW147_003022 [Coemansia sp. RSA 720]|nr:hypothetical protein IW147_003022 [Coemansia sp. RSA 720]
MKFAATFFTLAASAAAWSQTIPGPGVNPNLDKVLEGMPDDLVPFLGYVPQDFMNALIGGDAWLPLTPQEFLDIATGVPEESRDLFSEEYIKFISDVSSLLPSQPGQANDDDKAEDTEAPTATGSEEGEEGDLSEDEVSGDKSSGKESAHDHSDHSEGDDEDSDEDSESSGASALARPIAAIAMLAAAVSYF